LASKVAGSGVRKENHQASKPASTRTRAMAPGGGTPGADDVITSMKGEDPLSMAALGGSQPKEYLPVAAHATTEGW
jgi:hypothetical protein